MKAGNEDRLLAWLRKQSAKLGVDHLGDDGAILPTGGPWAVTQDHQIEGVHFPVGLDPRVVARRLLAVNLSDLAAMGAVPRYAFLALAAPRQFDHRRFFKALLEACHCWKLELAGGDIARHDRLTASLTLIGEKPKRGRWLRRSDGRPGDRLWLAGELGLSAIGRHLLSIGAGYERGRVVLPPTPALTPSSVRLARKAVRLHLIPKPQLEVGQWLARRQRAAAIDISDGLALDLHRLCRASELGAGVAAGMLPRVRGFDSLCQRLDLEGHPTLLAGGEDYALLFALPRGLRPPAHLNCRSIGELHAGEGVWLRLEEGGRQPLEAQGWDHLG